MLRRRRNTTDDRNDVIVEHGPSLAKGPNLIIGSILVAYGLSGLLRDAGQQFPSFSSNFPDGSAHGASWLGPEINGWTVWLTILCGALLLFGAAQHHLAKLMSLIVGLALGAAAIIALIDGDVLGLGAANGWTELGWGIAAVLLLLNVFSPRRRREHAVGGDAYDREPSYARGTAAGAGGYAAGRDRDADDATTTQRRGRFGRRDRDRDLGPDDDDAALAERERGGAVSSSSRTGDAPPPGRAH